MDGIKIALGKISILCTFLHDDAQIQHAFYLSVQSLQFNLKIHPISNFK